MVVQEAESGLVLMLAYADREALDLTLRTGKAHFFSRSRGRIWRKGEESGNEMEVLSVRADCDGDALLYLVRRAGPACHTGMESCFHREVWGELPSTPEVLDYLVRTIRSREGEDPSRSYTASLLGGGPSRVAQKVGEEGVELAIALVEGREEAVASEAADLLYSFLVALRCARTSLLEVARRLWERRRGPSTR